MNTRQVDIAALNGHLNKMALRARERVIWMSVDGGCFVGAAFSCVELLVYLYTRFLHIGPATLGAPTRDYFFLSKGHAAPALYAVLAEIGLLEGERLAHHLRACDSIYWHPNRSVPGVEFHSGSLGHGLAVAAGVALDCKLNGRHNKVVALLGDGELDEGSVWEACLVAAAYRLDNLVIVIDRNELQANVRTEDLIPLEPLGQKFRAFGCQVTQANGHDFADLERAFAGLPLCPGRPSVVIAHTVRGRGVPTIECRADRWFCKFSAAEAAQVLQELHHSQRAPGSAIQHENAATSCGVRTPELENAATSCGVRTPELENAATSCGGRTPELVRGEHFQTRR